MGGKRKWFEVRIREEVGEEEWVKKSRFYFVTNSSAAVAIYRKHARRPFNIMWCRKNGHHHPSRLADDARRIMRDIRRESKPREQEGLGVVGSFLKLGDELIKDIKNPQRGYNGEREEQGTERPD